MKKMEEIRARDGRTHVWRAPFRPRRPGAHHEGGTPNGYRSEDLSGEPLCQTGHPEPVVIGSSTFPSMSGFNPTLTIQALAYMSADAIVNRYKKNPGPLL